MKRILKMLFFISLSVLVTFGLVFGGMYIFGALDENAIYAQDLTFSSEEVVTSGTFGLQVDTATADVNKTTLVLETSNGGDAVIKYPQTITLGESFRIAPKKVSGSDEINVGGYVELYARYSGATSSQSVFALCKILIDVEVEEVAVLMPKKVVEVNDSIQIATAGEPLSTLLEINPINSLLPYSSRSVFGTIDATSIFSTTNLLNKKIFLEVFSLENNTANETDEDIVKFAVGSESGTESSVIEVAYEYDADLEAFVFSNDIFIKPGTSGQTGEMCLKAYYCPTYVSQKDVAITNIREKATSTSVSKESFNITSYSVDDISLTTTDRTFYLNEDTLIYINNSTKENNLGISLTSENGVIEDSIYKNNIYISVETQNISYILTKSNGDTTQNAFGLNTYVDDISEMSEWCWKFKLTDFLAYYNYTASPVALNKVKIKIEYNDGVDSFFEYFYVVPQIHKVDELSVKYSSNEDTSFYKKSGVSFQLTENDFDYDYTITPTYTDLAYYIAYDGNNDIVTIPSTTGSYLVEFDFEISIDGTLSFAISGSWCSVKSSNVVFTQGSKTYSIPYSASGVQSNVTTTVEFSADEVIHCEMNLTMLENITSSQVLFTVSSSSQTLEINGQMAKFYSGGSTLPILFINDVFYSVDFEYYENDEGRFIHILSTNSTYILSGIGSFSIVAELVYEDSSSGIIYWLGQSATVNVYTYTGLTTLSVQHYNTLTEITTFFDSDGVSYDESIGEDTPANYLFVTCDSDELDALYYGKDSLFIEFSQNFGELDTIQYENVSDLALSEINQNAITFGSWQEVFDNNSFVGYIIPYYILDIYSIEIDGEMIDNIFDVVVYFETETDENVYAGFAYSSTYSKPELSIEIKDKILTSTEIYYSGTSKGTTIDDPITLTATINNGNFAWNDGSNIFTNLPVQYSFIYEFDDDAKTISHMSERLTIADGSANSVSNVDAFHSFVFSSSGGGLSFKNFPYFEDGVIVKLCVYTSDSQSDETTHYVWTQNGFVKTINSGVSEGSFLYFKIIGLELSVMALNEDTLVGYKDNTFDLFSAEDAIFSLNNGDAILNGLTDFSNIFSVTAINSYVQVNATFTQITVLNDFLINMGIDISLSYANNEKINIESGEAYVQSYTQMVSGAFEITATTEFLAPSTTSFCTITYKKDNSDAVLENMVEATLSKISSMNGGNDSANNSFSISENALTFKTITGSLSTKLRLNLKLFGTELETDKDFDITITSIYDENDITVGEQIGEDYCISAGNENRVSITGGGIVLKNDLNDNKASINGISISFADVGTYSINASEHMNLIAFSSGPNVGLYSSDLNFNKTISVIFNISFADGGSFVVAKEIVIIKNITLAIDFGGFAKISGETINFSSVTYTVTRTNGGESYEIPDSDFSGNDAKYDASSFTYDVAYFEDVTSAFDGENILILQVVRPNETVQAGEFETTISFSYKPDNVDYELVFSYVFTLTIRSI